MVQVKSSCVEMEIKYRGDAFHFEALTLCDVLLTFLIRVLSTGASPRDQYDITSVHIGVAKN